MLLQYYTMTCSLQYTCCVLYYWSSIQSRRPGRNWYGVGQSPDQSVSLGPELGSATLTWPAHNMAEEDTDWSYSETIPKQTISTLSTCPPPSPCGFINLDTICKLLWSINLKCWRLSAKWKEMMVKFIAKLSSRSFQKQKNTLFTYLALRS